MLAIEGLHEQGIVHRDLKPENVLIDCHGHLVVTDFGASKIALEHEAEEDGDIRTNSWVGTEMYMAPEQLLGLVYGRVVDWWAIGVLAFEVCSPSLFSFIYTHMCDNMYIIVCVCVRARAYVCVCVYV